MNVSCGLEEITNEKDTEKTTFLDLWLCESSSETYSHNYCSVFCITCSRFSSFNGRRCVKIFSPFPVAEDGAVRISTRKADTTVSSQPCTLAAKAATSTRDCIRRSIASRVREVILPLLLSTGETHQECSVQLRAPQCKREMDILEEV